MLGEPLNNTFGDALLAVEEKDEADLEDMDDPIVPDEDILRRATPVGVLNVVRVVLSTRFPPALLVGVDEADDDDSLKKLRNIK